MRLALNMQPRKALNRMTTGLAFGIPLEQYISQQLFQGNDNSIPDFIQKLIQFLDRDGNY